ncbi:MAG: RidA family protein [Alphaproteobacteria bacterium]|nr:RidA family protein [Alphaproteobacteria bacterium]
MKQHRVWPKECWRFNVDVPASLGVRAGDTIHLGGQVALDTKGELRKPGDLLGQTVLTMEENERVLAAYGASLDDLVKLVVFYVDDGRDDGKGVVKEIEKRFKGANRPVLTLVPMNELAFPKMMVEIEGYAMRTPDGKAMGRQVVNAKDVGGAGGDFPMALRCGEMIYTGSVRAVDRSGKGLHSGNIVKQSELAMETINALLGQFGADLDDGVKINIYYVGKGSNKEEWRKAAEVRARYFDEPGPAATGIPVPRLHPEGVLTEIEVMAMLGTDGKRLPRSHVWPLNHWDWPIHLPYKHGLKCGNRIFVGGQVSMDRQATILHPNELVTQTKVSMENIAKVLAGFSANLDDVVKVNCFYVGGAGQETLMQSAQTRFSFYTPPGPCSTGVPLPSLAYDGMVTEIEVVAMA